MSDSYLILGPEDPNHVPPKDAVEQARRLLDELAPQSQDISARVTNSVEFIDCGGDFERFLCPFTGEEIEMDLWSEAMERAYESGFSDLSFESPINGQSTSLNDLNYVLPMGFARLSLEAMNPNVDQLDQNAVEHLEAGLRCKLRQIWRHI